MRNMYNFQSELWLIKSLKTAACKEREGEKERDRKGAGEAHRNCSISRSISSLTFYTISLGVNKACT